MVWRKNTSAFAASASAQDTDSPPLKRMDTVVVTGTHDGLVGTLGESINGSLSMRINW